MVSLRLMCGTPGSVEISEWLEVIWKVNEIATRLGIEPIFGKPEEIGPWWAGGSVEDYKDARLIFREDGSRTANLVSKTDLGAELLISAAEEMGIRYTEG